MSTGPAPGGYRTSEDEQTLHKLGYAQELFRAMGGFRNFAISFTIISILAGCLTSYFVAFERGGPVAVTWGWLLVGLMSTIIALSMAEIASAYPTAGGLYYWASKLGSPGWGWATGWFNLIGQVAVTAAIGYGLATFATILLDYWFTYTAHMDDWFGASPNFSIYVVYAICLLLAVAINLLDIRITSGLNMISAWWHMIGVVFIVGVLIIVPDQHQSLSYVFTETVNASGYGGGTTSWSNPAMWFVFGLGLLMAQYTITGFDASAHTAEETKAASRMAATGMWTSVFVSAVFGFILLVAVTFAIPSTDGALENIGAVVPWIWAESMSQNWSEALLFICCRRAVLLRDGVRDLGVAHDVRVLARPCCSRPSALAPGGAESRPALVGRRNRDFRGDSHDPGDLELPHRLRGRYGDRRDRPVHRVHPPCLAALAKGLSWDEPRAWSLGRHYKWIDAIAIAWVAIITILFIFPLYKAGLPWEDDFSWELTNYTVLWFAAIGIIFGGWWFVSAKNWFTGPVRMGTEEELQRLEEEQAGKFVRPTEAS